MGGVFSSGKDNDDLVDNLILLGYIKRKKIERVFRAVDRGDYVFASYKDIAYKDLSWKVGNIHLSAPCIYCKVMEGLNLKPGLSFLNIGSGTGYLSTMAGLLLGKNGTNHGIEMHEDCITYAAEHLVAFKETILDVDCFDFCEPVFKLGNILNVTPIRQYDRVYCGAECPEAYEQYIKQFVKIGGVLVMPYKFNLLRIERLGKNGWRHRTLLPVSYSLLVAPTGEERRNPLQLPFSEPHSLQELCRNSIRSHLRKLVWSEHNDLEYKMPIKRRPMEGIVHQLDFAIPFVEVHDQPDSELTDDDDETDHDVCYHDVNYDDDDDDDDDDEIVDERPLLPIETHRPDVVESTLHHDAAVQRNTVSLNSDDGRKAVGTSVNFEQIEGSSNDCRVEPDNSTQEITKDEKNVGNEMQRNIFESNDESLEDDHLKNQKPSKLTAKNNSKNDETDNLKNNETEARGSNPPDCKLRRKNETLSSDREPQNSQLRRVFRENEVGERNAGEKAPSTSSLHPTECNVEFHDLPTDDEDGLTYSTFSRAFLLSQERKKRERFEAALEQTAENNPDTSDAASENSDVRDIYDMSTDPGDMETSGSELDDDSESLFVRLLTETIRQTFNENPTSNREYRVNRSRGPTEEQTRAINGNSSESEVSVEAILSSSDFSGDEETQRDEKKNFRRTLRSYRLKRRSEEISESSVSTRSFHHGACCIEPSTDDSDPDPEDGSRPPREPPTTFYAHKIHERQLSFYMQAKISKLPLPHPLRIYINYNREL